MTHFAFGLINSVSGYAIMAAALFDGSTEYMSRSFGTGDNKLTRKRFLLRRGAIGTEEILYCPWSSVSDYAVIAFRSTDKLEVGIVAGGAWAWRITTDAVWRDNEWYDFEIIIDTAQTVYANGIAVIVGGVETPISSVSGFPPLNDDRMWNQALTHYIGQRGNGSSKFSGYLSADSFSQDGAITGAVGEFNNGNWDPLDVSGLTFGGEGYLFGEDIALGLDSSGNGNDWTVNGSVTAVTKTPTDVKATLNTHARTAVSSNITYELGNLQAVVNVTTTSGAIPLTLPVPDDAQTYLEHVTVANARPAGSGEIRFGVVDDTFNMVSGTTADAFWGWHCEGHAYEDGVLQASSLTKFTEDGEVLQVEIDRVANTMTAHVDEVVVGHVVDLPTDGRTLYPVISIGSAVSGRNFTSKVNVSEADWTYAAPTGFKELSVANMPDFNEGDVSNVFVQGAYVGTGAAQTISFVDDEGNLIDWGPNAHYKLHTKGVSHAHGNLVFDTPRGVTKFLSTNETAAEDTLVETVTAMTGSGFSIGTNPSMNTLGATYVYWVERAGEGTPEIDNTGTIQSTVSAGKNLSIVTWTSNVAPVAGDTVGFRGTQGARQAKWVIIKNLDDAYGWFSRFYGMAANGRLELQSPSGVTLTTPNPWNSVEIGDSLVTLGSSTFPEVNGVSRRYVMYVYFDEPDTHSSVFDYTGNTSTDGTFNYLGGTPVWSVTKSTGIESWYQFDRTRNPSNVVDLRLVINTPAAEAGPDIFADYVASGVKLRHANGGWNGGTSYIGMAWLKNRISPQHQPRGR